MKKLKLLIRKLDFNDLVLLVGAGFAFYGIWLIYKPASFILLGISLIYWAIQIERGKPNGRNK